MPRNESMNFLPCHQIHLNPAYVRQYWLTYHINAEFDFETEKWMYATGEARFQIETFNETDLLKYFAFRVVKGFQIRLKSLKGPQITLERWLSTHTKPNYYDRKVISSFFDIGVKFIRSTKFRSYLHLISGT